MYEFIKDDFHYEKDIVELRGFIINKAIAVEEVINHMLVFDHEKDFKKGLEYQDDKLQKMQWDPKLTLLKKVLLKYDLGELSKLKSELFDLLGDIIDIRHRMAHHRWSRVWKDGVHMKKYKLQPEYHLSEDVVRQYISNCDRSINIINKILKKAGYWDNLFSQIIVKPDE